MLELNTQKCGGVPKNSHTQKDTASELQNYSKIAYFHLLAPSFHIAPLSKPK